MKKIVFLGSKKVGYECLNYLHLKQQDYSYKIVGVLTNERGCAIREFCKSSGIRIIEGLDDLIKGDDTHIGISVQYHQILRAKHIHKFKDIIVNLHMAPLPEYRGCNQFTFAILNNDKEFGATIHRLDEGVDSGPILFERRFPVPKKCWVEELHEITQKESIELFREALPDLVKGNFQLISQEHLLEERKTEYHYRDEIHNLKQIDLGWDADKIEKYIRATSMPDFEPPYAIIGDKKLFLNINNENSTS